MICGWCLRLEALKWCWAGVGPVDLLKSLLNGTEPVWAIFHDFQLDRFSWT